MDNGLSRRGVFALGLAGLAAACSSRIPTGSPEELLNMPEYRLGPGDQMRVTVFGEAELSAQYVVNDQGAVAFPLVGDVPAAGQTLNEFNASLTEALRTIIRNPNVSVEVTNYRPYFILGEVRTPGTYPYAANLTVVNAVATAQGFTHRANRGVVFIKHANENAERRYRLTTTTPVRPGDTIRIAERHF
jgi:polysaccharide export outer membrane protein